MFEGFSPAYLGKIGFFLFFIAASYGQMDRIVDDGSKKMRPSRYIALLAPIAAILLYISNATIEDFPTSTKSLNLTANLSLVIKRFWTNTGRCSV